MDRKYPYGNDLSSSFFKVICARPFADRGNYIRENAVFRRDVEHRSGDAGRKLVGLE